METKPNHTASRRNNAAFPVRIPNAIISLVSIVVATGVWELFGRGVNPIFASYPSAIFVAAAKMAETGIIFRALFESLQPLAVGYVLAMLAGIPLGLLVGRYRWAEFGIGIYVTGFYAMPLVALIPLFVLWFGLGFGVKVAIILVLSIFPITINTWAGVKAVPKTLIEVGTSFVASNAAIMWKIIVPATLPYIMTGMRLAVGRAIIAMVVAEFFTAITGLGGIILKAGDNFDTARMFVPVFVLMALGIGLTALVSWLESKVAPWQKEIAGSE
ncbi:MAG: ABC transporter permease [Betaproteobacteria bacterium]|nr:ABC transporter permease [Betaproteobacteria bacterium]